jgi:flagellar basal-body rod modification protein FlgD
MDTGTITRVGTSTDPSITRQVKDLDKNAFLNLLIAELRNQDPMNPMEDKDFIAQLATFSSLEQLQHMNSSNTSVGKSAAATQATALIGRDIDFATTDGSTALSGTVESVVFVDGAPQLKVSVPGTDGGTTTVQIDPANVTTIY